MTIEEFHATALSGNVIINMVQDQGSNNNEFSASILSLIERGISEEFLIVSSITHNDSSTVFSIVNYNDEILIDLLAKLQSDVESEFNQTVSFGISQSYSDEIEELIAYENAIDATDFKFYYKKNFIHDYSYLQTKEEVDYFSNDNLYNELITALKKYDILAEMSCIERNFDKYRAVMPIPQKLSNYLQHIANKLKLALADRDKGEVIAYDVSKLSVENAETLLEMKRVFTMFINSVQTQLGARIGSTAVQVGQVIEYIKNNYGVASLSLADVCKHLSVSISYFSTVFKRETGKTFIECLTDYRMLQATYYLENSPLKIADVGHKCGYDNPHYFSMIFKKYNGMTPKEYRNLKHDMQNEYALG